MPLYEYRCERCGLTFEALAPPTRARHQCPECARPARRIMSAPVLAGGAREQGEAFDARARSEVAPIPPMARLCGMDDRSAERLAWHRAGRGAEYDERSAAAEEKKRRRGGDAPAKKRAAKPAHSHAEHGHA